MELPKLRDDVSYTYQEAVDLLNTLTSNLSALNQSMKSIHDVKKAKRDIILKYLNCVGIDSKILHNLSVIHIAGTKGKGMTSALCESILREHGYKTGFFSSPHLILVNERIRINGKPIEKDYFASTFSNIYRQIMNSREDEHDVPAYFGFLTVMALSVFINEKVDVAILEVGIGGEYDQTNIINNVPIVGIASLGFDHMEVLGNTIEEIARQKAGIMKPGCRAYTVPQYPAAMNVLYDVAKEKNCSLHVVPEYESYTWLEKNDQTKLEVNNPTKYLNASLAIQLAHSWMQHTSDKKFSNDVNRKLIKDSNVQAEGDEFVTNIPKSTCVGIKSTVWPGRCQLLKSEQQDFYIDGAHTIESMEVCADWFKSHCRNSSYKFLIFYVTKKRDPKPMLEMFAEIDFHAVLFVPDIAFDPNNSKMLIDQVDVRISVQEKVKKCQQLAEIWKELLRKHDRKFNEDRVSVFNSISNALTYIKSECETVNDRSQVLVTGSLLLAGAALTVLDPTLEMSSNCN